MLMFTVFFLIVIDTFIRRSVKAVYMLIWICARQNERKQKKSLNKSDRAYTVINYQLMFQIISMKMEVVDRSKGTQTVEANPESPKKLNNIKISLQLPKNLIVKRMIIFLINVFFLEFVPSCILR